MKSFLTAAAVAATLVSGSAVAADLPNKKGPIAPVVVSPWDFAIGAAVRSDYNFRGISQSDRGPGVTAYGEIRYNVADWLQAYAGISGSSVKLPTRPSAEIDLYAGVRPTFGNLAFDFGVMNYTYPREQNNLPLAVLQTNTDFVEFYGKAAYTFNDTVTLGANVFYAPNFLGTGAQGTYASLTGKVVLPYNFAASGELGHYWIGKNNASLGAINLPDYTYWNAGLSYTYKFATLDLRYHDTNLNKAKCYTVSGDPRGAATGLSKWCGQAFIATLSFDLTSKDIK